MIIKEKSSMNYFKGMIQEAAENQNIDIDEMTEFYIVNLLAEQMRSDTVSVNQENGCNEELLSSILSKAMETEYHAEKVRLFKKLGDFTLFVSGFFSDSLNRKIIDVDYYKAIGGTAYCNLSHLMRGHNKGEVFTSIFKDLADRFQLFVDIISEVSSESFVQSDKDLLRLYSRWTKTGSDRDAELLKQRGLIPVAMEGNVLN